MKMHLKIFFLIPLTALWMTSVPANAFEAPKSDVGLELLVDLLGEVFNFDLQEVATPRILKDEVVMSHSGYDIRNIELRSGDLGRIALRVKTPKSAGQYPVVFVFPGLNMNPSLFDSHVTANDDVIQVLVDYSFPPALSQGKLIYEVVRKSLNIQLLSAMALNWVRSQPMVDGTRISVVSVSYGSFVAPFSIRLAQLLGLDPYAVVFAYGGSDLKSLILPEIKQAMSEADFDHIKRPLSRFLDATSPSNHLPHLQTQTAYLVLKGSKDQVIPEESTKQLIERLPDPIYTMELNSPHIGANKPETIEQSVRLINEWLKAQGAF